MKILFLIIAGLFIVFLSVFLMVFHFFDLKENFFRKHLEKGNKCRFYIDANEHVICEVLEIIDGEVKLKSDDGDIYDTNIENIASP